MTVLNVCGVLIEENKGELVGVLSSRRVLLCPLVDEEFAEALVIEPDCEEEPWALLRVYRYTPYVYRNNVIFYCWNDSQFVGYFNEKKMMLYRARYFQKRRGFALFLEDGQGGRDLLALWFWCLQCTPTHVADIAEHNRELSEKLMTISKNLDWGALQRPDREIIAHGAYNLMRAH